MTNSVERRQMRRSVPEAQGIVRARVRPGRDVCVIDVCAGGALIETIYRLLPGAQIELHLATTSRRVAMRGRVLRCAVARLRASGVWYRGAIEFDGRLPWLPEDESAEQLVPICDRLEIRHGLPGRAGTSQMVIG